MSLQIMPLPVPQLVLIAAPIPPEPFSLMVLVKYFVGVQGLKLLFVCWLRCLGVYQPGDIGGRRVGPSSEFS
jgi:hypothetical protein